MSETNATPLMDRPIVLFLAVSFGLSAALGVIVFATGRQDSPYAPFGLSAMFFPAVAVLVCRAFTGERSHVRWSRFPVRYLPGVLLLIPIVMHLAMLSVAAATEGALQWQGWLVPGPDGLYHSPEDRGWGVLSGWGLAGRVLLNAMVGLAVVSLFALFEEIGWRAWLQPRFVARHGPRIGIALTAGVWALWHTPFALSGIHHLEGMTVFATALILPVGHLGAGLIIGWFWYRTQSIWLVALAHGSLNNWGQYAFKFMEGNGASDALLLLSGGIALVVTGFVLVRFFLPRAEPREA